LFTFAVEPERIAKAMEKTGVWEFGSRSTQQKIPSLLWKFRVCFGIHKNLPVYFKPGETASLNNLRKNQYTYAPQTARQCKLVLSRFPSHQMYTTSSTRSLPQPEQFTKKLLPQVLVVGADSSPGLI